MGLVGVGLAVMAAGQVKQGQAASAEGKSAENIANYNAAVSDREAKAQRAKASFDQKRQAKKGARTKSAMEARIAAAGGAGSQIEGELMAEQAEELELENLLIGYEGEIGAKRAESQATIDRLQGKVARRKGKAQATASYMKAGGTFLMGLGQAGSVTTGTGYNAPTMSKPWSTTRNF